MPPTGPLFLVGHTPPPPPPLARTQEAVVCMWSTGGLSRRGGAFAGAATVVVGPEGGGAGVVRFGQLLPREANDSNDTWGGHSRRLGPSGMLEEAVDGEGLALLVGHGELVLGLWHALGQAGG